MSVAEAWGTYKTAAYPDGMTKQQEHQLRSTFYAASLFMISELEEMSNTVEDDDVICDELDKLKKELCAFADEVKAKADECRLKRN